MMGDILFYNNTVSPSSFIKLLRVSLPVQGFSNRLFPFFRDRMGEPLTPRSVYSGFPAIVK